LSGRVVGALAAAIAYDLAGSYVGIMLIGAAGFVVGAGLLVLLPSEANPRVCDWGGKR
jgi:hypothetical protein